MNDSRVKQVIEVGFVRVEKNLCSCNYRVNMVVCGEERCATDTFDNHVSDANLYRLLQDYKAIGIDEEKKIVTVMVNDNIGFRIYPIGG